MTSYGEGIATDYPVGSQVKFHYQGSWLTGTVVATQGPWRRITAEGIPETLGVVRIRGEIRPA